MQYTDFTPGRTVKIAEKTCLFFSGFAYLGLHQLPAYKSLLYEGIEKFGAVFPSSRVANLRLSLYEELETVIAKLLNQEAAAVFSSGYLSSQAAALYASKCGQLIYAPETHPSLWVNNPALPTVSREEWVADTIQQVNSHPDNTFAIVADTVSPISGVIHSFKWLQELKKKVLVLVDDSHGIGIIGPEGQGSIYFLPQSDVVTYLITASLAKAYSTEGGMITGSEKAITAIRKLPIFSGSTSLPPANAYAWLQAKDLFSEQRRILQQNIAYLLHLVNDHGIHNPFALPIFILPPVGGLAASLQKKNIIISSFPYPFPDSLPVNRVVVSAIHTQEDITFLMKGLSSCL
ncbi:pyridoxal phosphate-dependent aminotransferase family protein [Chitinophaga silvatica]|uniref:Pyridoxal phosphate-dependent aminotransferase family protein n=1 Tax=Chitinophaga silvatica TaxID=2282649 RepID=A0A3E1YGE6_9BACT|nr:aminotransferase class I/II-fold pyridoxal phosphate-dependent enzyme [Chitinophaga silvatica]RFS26270.1 pyridoxal phosphate-dependent aminotransferase family protein [Chitinophaga silvatica]